MITKNFELALGRLELSTNCRQIMEAAELTLIPGKPETDRNISLSVQVKMGSLCSKGPKVLLIPKTEVRRLLLVSFGFTASGDEISFQFNVPTDSLAVVQAAIMFKTILGQALGHTFREMNGVVLHASALVRNGKSLIFLGPSGSGKSTLMGLGLRQGWKTVGDDVVLCLLRDGGARLLPISTLAGLSEKEDGSVAYADSVRSSHRLYKFRLLTPSLYSAGSLPAAVFFPKVTSQECTTVSPIVGPALRVSGLIGNCLNLRDSTHHQRQAVLNGMAEVGRKAGAYTVSLGSDVFERKGSVLAGLASLPAVVGETHR